MKRAQAWALAEMGRMGPVNVSVEPYMDYGVSWDNEYVSLHLLEPDYTPMVGYPLAHTPGTNGRQSAPAVIADVQSKAELTALTGKLAGAVVLVSPPVAIDLAPLVNGVPRRTEEETAGREGRGSPRPDPEGDERYKTRGETHDASAGEGDGHGQAQDQEERKMHRRFFYILMVLAIMLSLSTPALAQDSGRQSANGDAKSYIVIMADDAILAYDGDIAGYEATRPGKGNKVNPNSANVRKYEQFLVSKHDKSLEDAGVSVDAKVYDFAFALNGYSAILTQDPVDALKVQKGVVMVLEDQMRYADTDSSPTFLGLTAEGGAYVKGYRGDGVVVGIIDTGIWPEHPSFADDGSFPAPPGQSKS